MRIEFFRVAIPSSYRGGVLCALCGEELACAGGKAFTTVDTESREKNNGKYDFGQESRICGPNQGKRGCFADATSSVYGSGMKFGGGRRRKASFHVVVFRADVFLNLPVRF